MVHIIENPIIPLSTPIHEGMKIDSTIEITGNAFLGQQGGFTIELIADKEVALNVSVRQAQFGGGRLISLNHFGHRKWHRETHCPNPILIGQQFQLKIINERRKYLIHVNGICIGHYHHHLRPKKIRLFTIRGDVRVSKVHFENFEHMNGGGEQITVVAPLPSTLPAIAPVAQNVVSVSPNPPLYQEVYPNITPVVYSQPQVVLIDGYGGHHCHSHNHHC